MPEPCADQRQEPGRAGVESRRRKGPPVEGVLPVGAAQHLARRLLAQPAEHRNAAAVAAHRIVDAVDLAHMRQLVEGEGEIAHPVVRDAYPRQLREPLDHQRVQQRRAGLGRHLREARPAAEQHAPTVGRQPVIAEHPLGLGQEPSLGDQAGGERRIEFLGGNHMARHGNRAPTQRRRRGTRIAVRADEDLLGAHLAAGRREAPAAAGARDARHRRARDQDRARALGRIQKPAIVARRMDLAGTLDDQAAVVEVARHFLAHPCARQQPGAGARMGVEQVALLGLGAVMGRGEGAGEAPAALVVAGDGFARDHRLEMIERGRGVGHHRLEQRLVRLALQPAQPLADIDPAADAATVARAGPAAERSGLENDAGHAGTRQFQRRVEARQAAADQGDVGARRHVARTARIGRAPRIPPIRLGTELGVEQAVVARWHRFSPGGSAPNARLDRHARRMPRRFMASLTAARQEPLPARLAARMRRSPPAGNGTCGKWRGRRDSNP